MGELEGLPTPTVEDRLLEVENALTVLLRAEPEPAAPDDGNVWLVVDARDAAIFGLLVVLALVVAVKMGAA